MALRVSFRTQSSILDRPVANDVASHGAPLVGGASAAAASSVAAPAVSPAACCTIRSRAGSTRMRRRRALVGRMRPDASGRGEIHDQVGDDGWPWADQSAARTGSAASCATARPCTMLSLISSASRVRATALSALARSRSAALAASSSEVTTATPVKVWAIRRLSATVSDLPPARGITSGC